VTAQLDTTFRQQVFEQIAGLLPKVLDRDVPAVSEGTQLMNELGLRSATMLELLLELEDSLDVQIEVEDIDRAAMNTVGDLSDYIATHVATDD
jgi:acyl carrier protein